MANYTILEKQDIADICEYFGLTITAHVPMDGGAGNSSYLFTTTEGTKLVVTVCDDKPLAHVTELVHLLQHLAAEGFTTNQIVRPIDEQRDPVMVLKGKPVMVKHYLEGAVAETRNEAMLEQVGERMAALHQISAPDYLLTTHPYGKELFLNVTQEGIDPVYEAWLADRAAHLHAALPTTLPTCLIHGDLYFDNILFEGERLKALIDFEEACHYSRVFDLGMAIQGNCTEMDDFNLQKATALVRGYEQGQALETVEKKSLKLFIEYAAIATSYWNFWKFNIDEPLPEKANRHLQPAKLADAIRAIPQDVFNQTVFPIHLQPPVPDPNSIQAQF